MQKNKIILVLAIGLMFSPVFSLKAVETTTVNTNTTTQVKIKDQAKDATKIAELKAKLMKETDALRKNLETRKTEIEKKITEKKDSVKKKLEVKSQEKVKTTLEKIYNKFDAQMGKLSSVDAKLFAKLALFEKEGRDVSQAKAQYAIAKASLDKTRVEIIAARTVAVNQTSKETAKETMRDLVKNTETSIKATAEEYRKLLPLLAKVEGDNSGNVDKEVKDNNVDKEVEKTSN